jgi:hypothetical protein
MSVILNGAYAYDFTTGGTHEIVPDLGVIGKE